MSLSLKPLGMPDEDPQSSLRVGEFKPWIFAAVWLVALAFLYRGTLRTLGHLAVYDDNISHIFLIPVISAWLLYLDRKKFASLSSFDSLLPLFFLIPAALIAAFSSFSQSLSASLRLSGLMLSLVLFFQAGFVALAGRRVARESWFALAFLFFAVPPPEAITNSFIYVLQSASAAVAELLFNGSGVPVLRDGFVFHLPRVNIEVAQECSGIRSSIALLILAILVAHFAFRPFWKKAVFIAAGLAMMVLKNGVRITTLTLLANYVDPGFLYGRLHHEGGIVFFLLGLALLWPVYRMLRRGENSEANAKQKPVPA
jgi:exosortase